MSATFSLSAEWLDEHLAFAVPMRMAELAAIHRRTGTDIHSLTLASHTEIATHYGLVRSTPYWEDERQRQARRREPVAPDLYSLIATLGDSLFGESSPGKAAAVCAALTTGLAGAALTQPGGVTYRGHHWCSRPHDDCPRREAAG